MDNDLAGLGFMTWFHCLLVFNIAESEVTLSFVPLKVTSFFCLDTLDFFWPAFLKFKFWHSPRQNVDMFQEKKVGAHCSL